MKPNHHRNDRNDNRDRNDKCGHNPAQQQKEKDSNSITSSGRVRMMFGGDQLNPPRVANDIAFYGIGDLIEVRDRRREVQDISRRCQGLAHKLRDQEAAAATSPDAAKAKQKLQAMTAAAEFDEGLLSKVEEAKRELAEAMSAHEATLEETRQALETAIVEFRKVAMADAAVAIRKDSENKGSFLLELSAPTAKNCEFLFFKDLNLIQIYEELGLVGAEVKPRIFHVSGQVESGFFRIYPISAERIVLMTLCSPSKEYVVEQEHMFYHGDARCPALLRIEGRNNLLWEVVHLGTGQSHGTIGENRKIAEAAAAKLAERVQAEPKPAPEQPKPQAKVEPKPQPNQQVKVVSASKPQMRRVMRHDDSDVPVGTNLGEKLMAAFVPQASEAPPEPTVEQTEVPVEGGKKKKKAAKKKAAK